MLTTATFLPMLNPSELGITLDSVLQWLSWQAFVATFVGVAIGIFIGAVPGLTGTMGLALVLPFTLYMNTSVALGLLLGVYKGGMFGGAISAIAFGIPGTPSSAPTVFDGYELAKQGKPKKALEAAHYAGVTADFLSDLVLIVTFAPLALLALRFGPRELTALLFIALALLAVFAGR
jgi:putative tricarboxylic transport membrane protein